MQHSSRREMETRRKRIGEYTSSIKAGQAHNALVRALLYVSRWLGNCCGRDAAAVYSIYTYDMDKDIER